MSNLRHDLLFPFFNTKFLRLKFLGGNFFDGCFCVFACSSNYSRLLIAFNFLVTFPLVVLRTPRLDPWFLLVSVSSWRAMSIHWYRASFLSFLDVVVVASVASVARSASGPPFSKSSYSSIIKLPYLKLLLKMPSRRSENNIIIDINVRYTIKNLRSACSAISKGRVVDRHRKRTGQKRKPNIAISRPVHFLKSFNTFGEFY